MLHVAAGATPRPFEQEVRSSMSGLALQDVSKHFGNFTAVDNVQLTVPHGTFVCMLGPSGCGKTTLLRMIAGLEEPTSGAHPARRRRTSPPIPTHQRNLGMVFQSLALFPHLTVGENIAYPLAYSRRVEATSRRSEPMNCSTSSNCPASPIGRSQALRRAAAAGGDRAGAGHLAEAVPARRAALRARRQAARGDAGRTAPAAAEARHHHDRRHP